MSRPTRAAEPGFIHNARRARRVPLSLRAEASVSGTRWMGELADLGPGGCQFLSERPLVPGTALRLLVQVKDLREALNVAGQVAWAAGDRAGVAFSAQQAAHPQAWFEHLLRAQPRLAEQHGLAPERLSLESSLYLQTAPRHALVLCPEERALLQAAEHGTPVRELLSRAALPEKVAHRALFALFEKKVLTLALGEAGEPWRWRAMFPAADSSPLPSIVRAPRAEAPVTAPVMGRLAGAGSTSPRTAGAAEHVALLRGASVGSRPPAAQSHVEEARRAALGGKVHEAVAHLREALSLAPRDPEISRLLGQLAFKDWLVAKPT